MQNVALNRHAVLSEAETVERNPAATPDERFVSLVERRSRFLYQVAFAVLRNPHDADDVVQETFLKLYRTNAWKNIREEKSFLGRTVWRMAVDRLKTREGRFPITGMPSSPAPDPEAAAIAADWTAIVHKLMEHLPEELRQPLALSAIEELESKEIAAILGIPEGTVRTRVLRARTVLKEKLHRLMEGRREQSL